MSLPRYPNYKDSGVEWLGEVPGHWEVIPLSRTASDTDSMFIDGDWIESKDLSDDGIRYLTSGNVGDGFYKEQGQGFISEATFAALNCIEVFPGDVLISRLNLPIGRSCLVPDLSSKIVTCVDNVIVRPSRGFDRRFFVYALSSKSHFANMENLARGTTMQRISRSTLGRVRFAFPPLEEQTQIAAFLDRETAKIDELVAEQRRLMALLKEKRQAVISHAVTRGLNPDAPLKSSGIEWLGDVPAHWVVTVIKRFSKLQRGYDLTDAERTEGSYAVVTSAGVNGTHGAFMAKGPGVVTGRYGSTGRLFYIQENFWPHNTSLYVSEFHGNYPRFVWYSLQTVDFAAHSAKAAVPGIDRNDIHVLFVTVPPVNEQLEIVDFLDGELDTLDTLTTEAQRAIDLLQERRTALISAAVTGQIDVRSAVAA